VIEPPTYPIGWCHTCGTIQLLQDAPWLRLSWYPSAGLQPCCVVCREQEPWYFGVFDILRRTPEDEPHGRYHGERQDVDWQPFTCPPSCPGRG
jgi:hypothetical protein